MNKQSISVKKLSKININDLPIAKPLMDPHPLVLSFNAEMMRLGFIMDEELMERLTSTHAHLVSDLAKEVIGILKEMKGADVEYTPMYPNFPRQVMEAHEVTLYMNAIAHYWSAGQWLPDYEKLSREFELEPNVKYRTIGIGGDEEFFEIFTTLLRSNESLSTIDKGIVEFFLSTYDEELTYPKVIPYKENVCLVARYALLLGKSLDELIKTPTDILRVITHLSEGDISLSTNTKFKSLPRKHRRTLLSALNNVINEEDIKRHYRKWNKAFHMLHTHDYAYPKIHKIAEKVYNNKKLHSVNSKVHQLVQCYLIDDAVEELVKRPGEFARKLDHLLRTSSNKELVIEKFLTCADAVSTRVLMQLVGHFKHRSLGDGERAKRVAFPKGNTQRAQLIPPSTGSIPSLIVKALIDGIKTILVERFSALEHMGKVWIDDRLKGCPLPAQMRSASEALDTVARGTRLPLGSDSTIRLFVYWVGQDIDLSATFHDENFNMIERVAWTQLKSAKYQSYHSGDLTSARNGGSEFIDIDIESASNHARYLAMNVLVYTGPTFDKHDKCYVGWMTRDKVHSNEIYDPATVKNKLNLNSKTKLSVPVLFDLHTKEVIWCDLSRTGQAFNDLFGGRTVESNQASISEVMQSIVTLKNKATLHDLFSLHIEARGGEYVESKEDADIKFGLNEDFDLEEIGPRNVNIINADFLS